MPPSRGDTLVMTGVRSELYTYSIASETDSPLQTMTSHVVGAARIIEADAYFIAVIKVATVLQPLLSLCVCAQLRWAKQQCAKATQRFSTHLWVPAAMREFILTFGWNSCVNVALCNALFLFPLLLTDPTANDNAKVNLARSVFRMTYKQSLADLTINLMQKCSRGGSGSCFSKTKPIAQQLSLILTSQEIQ